MLARNTHFASRLVDLPTFHILALSIFVFISLTTTKRVVLVSVARDKEQDSVIFEQFTPTRLIAVILV